jgi:large subunit ribosomal protein L10
VNRTEKTDFIERLSRELAETPHVILTSFHGLTANQANELRSKVRQAGGRFRVIKNRLARRAATGTAVEPMADRLSGPCALVAHATDPVGLAKSVAEFSKANPQLEVLAAVVDARSLLETGEVKRLASLPGLPELRAQLLRMILTPATTLVRLLGTPAGSLARVLDARARKEEGTNA